MGRRFTSAGLGRRLARSPGARGSSAPATPFSIFGANLVHEWDAALSTITIATGVSSISDLRGGKNLTQASGAAQPSLVSAGLQSYILGNGSQYILNAAMSLSGDLTMLVVSASSTATPVAGGNNIMRLGSNGMIVQTLLGTGVRGAVADATGTDIILNGATIDTAAHAYAVRNATGVSRKFYADGGAGVAGVRTDAMVASTAVGLFTNPTGAPSGLFAGRVYWAGIVAASPSLANLNLWGAWSASRFGNAWSTAT